MIGRFRPVAFCLLAPLALLFPWAAVPSHLGVAVAGWPFFREWLTRYPTLGPINWEVGAGIVCILGSSLLPLAFGLYFVLTPSPRRSVLLALALAGLLVFVPVLIRLDLQMWMAALLTKPPFGHPRLRDCGGTILRLLAAANLIVLVARRRVTV